MRAFIVILAALLPLVVGGCATTVTQIGKINMVSNRNIETDFDYGLLSSYAGGSEREIVGSRAETIEQAIDNTVKNVPGGEFLMNAVIYLVERKKDLYFAAQGDVWGRTDDVSYRGFKVGDRVTFKKKKKVYEGVITGLEDSERCYVKIEVDGEEKRVEVPYDVLAKAE